MEASSRALSRSTSRSRPRTEYIYNYPTTLPPDDILKALLSGIDIVFVDPNLYSYIMPSIEKMLDKYTYLNEQSIVKKLEFLKNYIEDYPRRTAISKALSYEEPEPPQRVPAYSEEELEEELDYIIENETFKSYTADQAIDLIEGMKRRKQEYLEDEDYMLADRVESIINKLYYLSQLRSVKDMQDKEVTDLRIKIKQAEKELEESKKRWEKILVNMQTAAKEELTTMEKEHQERLENLKKLREQKPPPSIVKYSNVYLDMRAKQRAMIRNKSFAAAADMRDKADVMQAEENHMFIVKWNRRIDNKIQNENDTYAAKFNARVLFWKNEETNLVKDADSEIAKAEKAIRNMKTILKNSRTQKRITTNALSQTKRSEVKTLDLNERPTPLQHRQRAILNKKLYTMTPRKRPQTAQLPYYRKNPNL